MWTKASVRTSGCNIELKETLIWNSNKKYFQHHIYDKDLWCFPGLCPVTAILHPLCCWPLDILTSLWPRLHEFADDLQLYLSCQLGDLPECELIMRAMLVRLDVIKLTSRLNLTKMQFIWFHLPLGREWSVRILLQYYYWMDILHLVQDLGVLPDRVSLRWLSMWVTSVELATISLGRS